ncbi:helix-turn-helix domain-containing protein [Actinacidiphila acididurans]|uniref:Helix-turn-helix domain-containing protein n=1 Tax=Actinacidiphila acididurans TaxID=2784346 RepID=A0ABS2U4M7_9ACTN|nr:helix-turn-helix domain-containing protein [Actinacidiphila acididurans]MBM9509947.1 helix-turn-helix domain-containing protein [Actinacidiphila acididurans]
MSIEHMAMVFAADGIDAKERLLLLAYTNRCDDHGFCWPGEERLIAETGMSASTLRRAKKELTDMGLVKSVRRPDTSSMTRINLKLLASMKRPDRPYDDNLIEKFGFAEDREETEKAAPDLRTVQDDLTVRSSWPGGQVKMTPGPGQDDLETLSEPSVELSVEPEAPSARSARGVRSTSSSGSGGARAGGSAASSKTPPSPQQRDDGPAPAPQAKVGKAGKGRQRGHTRQELAQARAVCDLFPPELGVSLVPVLTDAILGALTGDVPAAGRTVEQLGARIERRWNLHGYAAKHHAGTLASPVGAAVAMVRPLKRGDQYGCANPRCEEGTDVDTGEPCTACPERLADRRRDRRQAGEPDHALRKAEEQPVENGGQETPPVPPQRSAPHRCNRCQVVFARTADPSIVTCNECLAEEEFLRTTKGVVHATTV